MVTSKYGSIDEVDTFKFLGEIIQVNRLEKKANNARARKVDLAYQLIEGVYSKKNFTRNIKIRY